jgi:hypothetical protein
MGNAKVVLSAGISLIIGMYAMGIKTAERTSLQAAVNHANMVAAEELSWAGVHMAMDDLASQDYIRVLRSNYTKVISGDTIRYSIVQNGTKDTATVSVLVKVNNYEATVTALTRKIADPQVTWWGYFMGTNIYRGRWAVIKVYARPL